MLKNKKMLILIITIALIIIAGIFVTWKYGFKYDLLHGDNTKVQVDLGFNFDKAKLEPVVKEVFGTYKIQTAELTKSSAIITVKSLSDDQKTLLVEKINNAYELELTADDLTITNNPKIDIKTTINQYVLIVSISIIIIEAYIIIRFRKLGIIKVIAISLSTIILSQIITISLIAITRIELETTIIPMLLAIFVADWYIINTAFEEKV